MSSRNGCDLQLSKLDTLSDCTNVYQTNDGRIYYWNANRLSTKWQGTVIMHTKAKNDNIGISIHKIGNIILMEDAHRHTNAWSSDSSPFVYFSHFTDTFDVLDTMSFLPPLRCENVQKIVRVVAVHNGSITVNAFSNKSHHVMAAVLPIRYYENRESAPVAQPVKHGNNENPTAKTYNDFDRLIDHCCCVICTECFDSSKHVPLSLDCGHSFCEACILTMRACNTVIVYIRRVKCPNCSTSTNLPDGRTLPRNFALISITEQILKSNKEPKVTCNGCKKSFSPECVRLCDNSECAMFNKIICMTCALDGGHGGHALKYEFMENIRSDLREELDRLKWVMENKKMIVLDNTDQLTEVIREAVEMFRIPHNAHNVVDKISSEQEAAMWMKGMYDLEGIVTEYSDNLNRSLNAALKSANGLDLSAEITTWK